MNQVGVYVGVDIAKADFKAAIHGAERLPATVNNNAKAIRAWLKQLPRDALIAVEATGEFHLLLATLAHRAGFTVFVLNPAQLSHYARSIGRRAKTDRLDAEMLARYLANEHQTLHPWQPLTQAQQTIDRLVRKRALLVKQRAALRQSTGELDLLRATFAALDRSFGKAIREVDKALREAVADNGTLKATLSRLTAIPGVGPLVSLAVANRLSSVPLRSADAAVAYLGLDPRTRESGMYRGKRKLSKRGDPELRRLLYVAAMTTARHAAIAPMLAAYKKRGLSAIASYNILARRLVRTIWSLMKTDTQFDLRRFVNG